LRAGMMSEMVMACVNGSKQRFAFTR